ncbi:MAG: ferrochelatase [uncultured archaeon A07HN63]|nr:MAG: ferrochelatase [uncultured archaeon A07HN63]
MATAIVLLNFGEPADPDRETVLEYLTRIFYDNASLEDAESEEEAWERSRELAQRRLPGLMEEYEEIGGSPLQAQAANQADALTESLADRGHDVTVYHAMQFMEPLIEDIPETLADDGMDEVIALPIYPLCGPSTTVSSIDLLEDAIDEHGSYEPAFSAITGWHRVPLYNRIRAEGIESFLAENDVDPNDPETTFVFSAHGTPTKYLDEGYRYDEYVEEHAAAIAGMVGIEEYEIGYQNHANRGIEWTEPETEELVEGLGDSAERVVVEPMSFMHEQSETLVELDIDLMEDADAVGLDLYRVPVPHDDSRFPTLLADVIEPFLSEFAPAYYQLRQCQCRNKEGTYCFNAELPPQEV